ncbi:MAG: bifunctional ornithine acetyltransferase/N-acetylglutamate synthase, partial [Phycisphaerae bacterium]|nr:bifunctional ornithine acetyltransferase/N-acetylglutamate synthase [Phycisphaerae bacterium]
VEPKELQEHLRAAVDRSFHRISIDGDTSTNDAVFALASGAAVEAAEGAIDLRTAMIKVARELALLIVRDGEGYERGIHVRVTGARAQADALAVARTIASSLLVRCAVTGGDPNWGRILAAAGRSGVAISEASLDLRVGGVPLFARGQPSDAPLADRNAAFRTAMVEVHLDLGQGTAEDEFISCGLTKAYVELNADYTT